MVNLFAATDVEANPLTFYFTQGVLGVSVVLLIIALRYIFTYYNEKLDQKDEELKLLNKVLFDYSQTHAKDYMQLVRDNQSVLLSNSQAIGLVAGKIENVKGRK